MLFCRRNNIITISAIVQVTAIENKPSVIVKDKPTFKSGIIVMYIVLSIKTRFGAN